MNTTQTVVPAPHPSKKQRAIELYNRAVMVRETHEKNAKPLKEGEEAPKVPSLRQTVIAQLKSELTMTQGGASTYFANMHNKETGWTLETLPVPRVKDEKPAKAVKATKATKEAVAEAGQAVTEAKPAGNTKPVKHAPKAEVTANA